MMQTFYILGDPRPQGRPRFYKRGNFIGVYDPKESRNYKQTLAAQIAAQNPEYIQDGAISLECEFIFARPKTLPKKVVDHTKKPDLDNLLKALKDAMTGIVWHDDAQIVSLSARKDYGDVPGIKMVVRS
ncbi:MAG: Endodeoxyribonuclease RusA [Deltaproteobacteria bacterium ADurb.Bin135]|jgi:Holliday junction resolvase RusA-like endonuclease|nr:MAG: Endodeoxyribonuclease RusA [Deltaproteobacteria bacterium ADurb.Bin135]